MTKTRSVAATANDNSIPGSRLVNESVTEAQLEDISAEKILFLQNGVGAQNTRSVQEKLQDSVSVKDFGAIGDGVASDWSAFLDAIAYITEQFNSTGVAPALYIPCGLYRIPFGLSIDVPMDVYGEGPQSSLIFTETGGALFTLTGNSGGGGRTVRFRDIQIVGSYENIPNQHAINITSGESQRWVDVENCIISRVGGSGIRISPEVDVAVSLRVNRCTIEFCRRGDGISLNGAYMTDTRITECRITYNKAGILIGDGAQAFTLWINGCLIENNVKGPGGIGPNSRPSAGIINLGAAQNVWIQNCYFEQQLYPILHRGGLFQNVTVNQCLFAQSLAPDHAQAATDIPDRPTVVTISGTNASTISITECSGRSFFTKPNYLTDDQWHTYDVVNTITGEGSSGSTTLTVSQISTLYPGALISISGLSGYYTVGAVNWAPNGVSSQVTLTSALASEVIPGTTVTVYRGTTHPYFRLSSLGYGANNYGKGLSGSYENPYYYPSTSGTTTSFSSSRDPNITQGFHDVKLPERTVIKANYSYSVICRAGIFSSISSSASGFFTGVYSSQGSVAGSSCASVLSSFNSRSNHDSTLVLSSQSVDSNSPFKVVGGFGGSPTSGRSTANRKWEIDSVTGDITIAGTLTQGATFTDFAEYFENLEEGVIPLGTIVTLVGAKVKVAGPGDRIIGVVSATAAIAAGDSPFHWANKYAVGDFGEPLYDEIPLDSWKPDEGQSELDRPTIKVRRLNPDYDDSLNNAPRSERPEEWTCVGLIGQVFVRVSKDVKSGDFVSVTGDKAKGQSRLQCMTVTKPFSEQDGFAIAKCLLI